MITLNLMSYQNALPIIRKEITHLTKLLCLLLCMSLINNASGQVTVELGGVRRTFSLTDGKVFENGNTTPLAENVEKLEKDFGYTNPSTNEGKEEDVLYIKKIGENKPKIFLNNNFNTEYLKQDFGCNDVRLKLYGTQVFQGQQQILENCQILRCENNYTLAHQHDGKIQLYVGGAETKWLEIKQIITIDNTSYYIKKDDANTIWRLGKDNSQPTEIGFNAYLLQDNDNQLIRIDTKDKYFRWDGKGWASLTPKYVSVSPEMIDEGFWFFIQAKPLLNNASVDEQKKGLCYNAAGALEMKFIPRSGDCDRFLWRTKKVANGKRQLINKVNGSVLSLGTDGKLTVSGNAEVKEWDFKVADKAKLGNNAYQIIASNNKALSFTNSAVGTKTSASDDLEQVWLLQFNQMVRDYFIPRPTKSNLDAHFKPATNAELYKLESSTITKLTTDEVNQLRKKIEESYVEINKSYNKFLKGDHGVSLFATNTSSDWSIVNYYFIINNMMNAVNKPKPSYTGVETNDLSYMNGRNLVIINKNDLSSEIPKQFFSLSFDPAYLAKYRGGSGYRQPHTAAIITSEELTCKTGIVNRPLDKSFRRFDHGIHEFGHALQELGKWVDIAYAQTTLNGICDDWDHRNKTSRSPECICWMIQNWFNNSNNSEYYPTKRADNDDKKRIMEIIFDNQNTWMPPKDLRNDGYNPSTFSLSPFFVDGEIYQVEGVGGFAGKYWTVTGVGPNDQLGFRALPANPAEADIKKTQFKIVAIGERPRAIVFESVSNPGYYLYPIRPAGKPWLVGLKNTNLNDLKNDMDGHFILVNGVTGNPAHFSVFPRKNQAWVAGCGFPGGIGMHMPGAFGYTPEGHWKGAFIPVPKNN